MNTRTIFIALVVLGLAAMLPAGCSKRSGEPTMFTGRVISREAVSLATGGVQTGKLLYAEVNSAWLTWAYDDFRRELSDGVFGVVGWDNRSQCTLFASAFEVYCQKRYFAQGFHASIPAPGIAVGTRWYQVDDANGHALNLVLTERGLVDFEPQTGRFVALTQRQIASSYLKKFD